MPVSGSDLDDAPSVVVGVWDGACDNRIKIALHHAANPFCMCTLSVHSRTQTGEKCPSHCKPRWT